MTWCYSREWEYERLTEQADLIQLDLRRFRQQASTHACSSRVRRQPLCSRQKCCWDAKAAPLPPVAGRCPDTSVSNTSRSKRTAGITTQLALHQALKPRRFDASDRNRQAQKRHLVANEHSGSARQTCIAWLSTLRTANLHRLAFDVAWLACQSRRFDLAWCP